jgi:hypothetical protein
MAHHQIPADWLVAAEMQGFKPSRSSYRCDGPHDLIPLADIEPPKRNAGIVFDGGGFKRERTMTLLAAIRDDASLPPIRVAPAGRGYCVFDGFHRFYVSRNLGFSHIPVVVVG